MSEQSPAGNRTVWLRENVRPSEVVQAALVTDFPAERLAEVEAAWEPWRARRPDAEHSHWDWRNKTDPDVLRWLRLFAIERDGVQGLMAVLNRTTPSRLAPDAHLIYVSVLETAPWNLPHYTDTPLYSGCGTQLLAAAVAVSVSQGCGGRIGLHSLEQAEPFYEHCGMTRVGPDVEYGRLVYYEFTPGQAAQWLARIGFGS